MNQISSIGVNSKGFNHLLSVRFYVQMVRSQMDYDLAISILNLSHLKKLETCQNACIRRIFRGSSRSSVKVMLHLVQQRPMIDRVAILQAKYLMHSLTLLENTVLSKQLPHLEASVSRSHWYNLTEGSLWRQCIPSLDELDHRKFKQIRNQFLLDNHACLCDGPSSKLLSACRSTLTQDPVFWFPTTRTERSCIFRWRLGWLPGGKPKPCIYHSDSNFTRFHATELLHMHSQLQLPFQSRFNSPL